MFGHERHTLIIQKECGESQLATKRPCTEVHHFGYLAVLASEQSCLSLVTYSKGDSVTVQRSDSYGAADDFMDSPSDVHMAD